MNPLFIKQNYMVKSTPIFYSQKKLINHFYFPRETAIKMADHYFYIHSLSLFYCLITNLKIMKNSINFTDYLNSCLKRQPSLKSTSHLKMGLTVNTFHANVKAKKHTRTKTDELCAPQTMSTTSIFVQGKLKGYQHEKRRKKTQSELQLKKANSFKILDSGNQFKSCSTYKSSIPSKQSRAQTQTIRSIQKLRKNIENNGNPEVAHEQLKQINSIDKKNAHINPLTNQYYLLSNDLLQTIKKMQKKHAVELLVQKQTYQKREQKMMNKIIEVQRKNQRCTTLINQLRIRNIDVDSIWHEEKLGTKIPDLIEKN